MGDFVKNELDGPNVKSKEIGKLAKTEGVSKEMRRNTEGIPKEYRRRY
jgi:hypothetical protein